MEINGNNRNKLIFDEEIEEEEEEMNNLDIFNF